MPFQMRTLSVPPISKLGKLAIVSMVIEAIVIIILEAYVANSFLKSDQSDSNKGIPVYLLLFVTAQLFANGLVVDFIWNKNVMEMCGFLLFHTAAFAYALFQYFQLRDPLQQSSEGAQLWQDTKGLLIAIFVIMGAFTIFFYYLGYYLWREFGWNIYKRIGADPRIKRMYRAYLFFQLLIKLDLFFFLIFSVQFLALVLEVTDVEFGLTIAALPVTLIILGVAIHSLKRENLKGMIVFLVGCAAALAYFIFKLVRMYDPARAAKFANTKKFLTFFAAICIALVCISFAVAVRCIMNFNRGLRVALLRGEAQSKREAQRASSVSPTAQHPPLSPSAPPGVSNTPV